MAIKFRYEEFTWPEIREAAEQNRVAVLPVGTVEQHGTHLPLGTDALTAAELARLAVKRAPKEAVLLPPVYYGASEHQMDFPGSIAIDGSVVAAYVGGIASSLARHGFRKILVVNGDDGNAPLLAMAARNVNNTTESLCAVVSWPALIPASLLREMQQPLPGEVETSVMLYLRGDLVQTDRAEKEAGAESAPGTVILQEPVSRYSRTGMTGNPAAANSDNGRRLVEVVVERLAGVIRDLRGREIRPRVDHH